MVIPRLESRDLRPSDVLKAVNHIGRQEPSAISGNFRMKIHQIAREVRCHIVSDVIVKSIDTVAIPAILALTLKPNIEVHGLLRFQIGVSDPVVAETRTLQPHRRTCVHLPVVVQLPHARLCITRADIRLEALVRLSTNVVRHADIERRMCAEKAAVIDAQNWRKQCISIDLPCVLQKHILLLDLRCANRQSVLPRLKFLIERFSVPKHRMSIHFTIIISKSLVIVVIDCQFRRINNLRQIMVSRIINQLLTECHESFHNIRRRRIPIEINSIRSVFQIVLIRIGRCQRAPGGVLMSIPLVFIVILRYSRFISRHRIVVHVRRWRTLAAFRIKVLIVIPRINHARIAVRRIFDTAAFTLLLRIANAVGQQMIAAQLRIRRCLETPLLMHEGVDVVERVLSLIGGIDIVRGQRDVVLVHLCIVKGDIPV